MLQILFREEAFAVDAIFTLKDFKQIKAFKIFINERNYKFAFL